MPNAIEKALQGEERCVLDTMRLVDLLLVLLFEGRKALPKTGISTSTNRMRRLDSSGEKTHRQLIECIRSKDTDALIDAIDSGGIEVNFMDDVGQTLLNWASAFGTQEMVEILCERGADVNKGKFLLLNIIIVLQNYLVHVSLFHLMFLQAKDHHHCIMQLVLDDPKLPRSF